MATVVVEMLGTAAGPDGTYLAGKQYEIDEKLAKSWETPNPNTGTVYAKILRPKDVDPDKVLTEPDRDTEDKKRSAG